MIYVLRTKGAPFIKIGFSDGVFDSRIKSLQTGCPYKIELIHTQAGEIKEEKAIQRKLKQFKASGEWFHMTEETLKPFGLSVDSPVIDPSKVQTILTRRMAVINDSFYTYRRPRAKWIESLDAFCEEFDCTFAELSRIPNDLARFQIVNATANEIWEKYKFGPTIQEKNQKMLFLINKKLHEKW